MHNLVHLLLVGVLMSCHQSHERLGLIRPDPHRQSALVQFLLGDQPSRQFNCIHAKLDRLATGAQPVRHREFADCHKPFSLCGDNSPDPRGHHPHHCGGWDSTKHPHVTLPGSFDELYC
jgi:hypothetical protein